MAFPSILIILVAIFMTFFSSENQVELAGKSQAELALPELRLLAEQKAGKMEVLMGKP